MKEEIKVIRKKTERYIDRITVNVKDQVPFLTFPVLEQFDWIVHGFSTRLGGVSLGDQGSMNTSFSREPDADHVRENHRRLAAAIGYDEKDLVFSCQTHTTNVLKVTGKDRGNGYSKEQAYQDIDGLITDEPGLVLATFYADCVPLYIVDPVHRAIGSSHSGWRGTVANMGKATLDKMNEAYGTRPQEVYAAIGPSICQDCYEVSSDVIDQFREAYPEPVWDRLFYEKPGGRYQLNLQEACRLNFMTAGVPESRISIPDLCTCCNPDFFFSHRASGGRRGNLAAFLGIRK